MAGSTPHQYPVVPTDEPRDRPGQLARAGRAPVSKGRHARILLLSDGRAEAYLLVVPGPRSQFRRPLGAAGDVFEPMGFGRVRGPRPVSPGDKARISRYRYPRG